MLRTTAFHFWRFVRKKEENAPQKKEKGAAAYQLGNTSSRTITEVKQR